MDDFPEYTSTGKDALDLFLAEGALILFFFEDSYSEAIYERLINRIFPKIRKFSVICLEGKEKVIAKARRPREQPVQYIFVVDLDFDDILGRMVDIPDLYYWKKNCFENFLLSPQALAAICVEEKPRVITDGRAAQLLADSEEYLVALYRRYTEITRIFLVARRFRVSMETTKMAIEDLLEGADSDYPIPTEDRIDRLKSDLQEKCNGDNEWLADSAALQAQIEGAFLRSDGTPLWNPSIEDHLNGKHLFRCLVRYVSHQVAVDLEDMDFVALYVRLVSKIAVESFSGFCQALTVRYPSLIPA